MGAFGARAVRAGAHRGLWPVRDPVVVPKDEI
jgi:hypothetical protein